MGWTGVLGISPLFAIVTPSGAASVVHEPNPAALALIVGAGLVWYGVRRGKDRWAGTGTALILAFSVLFMFGPGGILIPLALSLVIVLITRRVLGRRTTLGRSKA